MGRGRQPTAQPHGQAKEGLCAHGAPPAGSSWSPSPWPRPAPPQCRAGVLQASLCCPGTHGTCARPLTFIPALVRPHRHCPIGPGAVVIPLRSRPWGSRSCPCCAVTCVRGAVCRVHGAACRVPCAWCRVLCACCRVHGAVCRACVCLPALQRRRSPCGHRGTRRDFSPRLRCSGDRRVLPCRDVRQKVQLAVAQAFGISASSLHLTKPTFFSRINSTEARTAHDEYWHAHVDKVRPGRPARLSGPRAPAQRPCVQGWRPPRQRWAPPHLGGVVEDVKFVRHMAVTRRSRSAPEEAVGAWGGAGSRPGPWGLGAGLLPCSGFRHQPSPPRPGSVHRPLMAETPSGPHTVLQKNVHRTRRCGATDRRGSGGAGAQWGRRARWEDGVRRGSALGSGARRGPSGARLSPRLESAGAAGVRRRGRRARHCRPRAPS